MLRSIADTIIKDAGAPRDPPRADPVFTLSGGAVAHGLGRALRSYHRGCRRAAAVRQCGRAAAQRDGSPRRRLRVDAPRSRGTVCSERDRGSSGVPRLRGASRALTPVSWRARRRLLEADQERRARQNPRAAASGHSELSLLARPAGRPATGDSLPGATGSEECVGARVRYVVGAGAPGGDGPRARFGGARLNGQGHVDSRAARSPTYAGRFSDLRPRVPARHHARERRAAAADPRRFHLQSVPRHRSTLGSSGGAWAQRRRSAAAGVRRPRRRRPAALPIGRAAARTMP